MKANLTICEDQPALEATSIAELELIISNSAEEEQCLEILNIIFIEVPNGNSISLVVGGYETVLGFTYGYSHPPYYVSRGAAETEDPVFTAFVLLMHHTEFLVNV